MISPHGRCCATTCVGGRVRPPLPPRAPPAREAPPGREAVPRVAPFSGLRSLAKASPRCWGSVRVSVRGAFTRRRASLGRVPDDPLAPEGHRGGQYARAVTPEQLQDVVRTAVAAVVDRGELPVDVPGDVVIERPKNPEHGDYATNVALRLAKPAGRPPREVAELLAAELRAQPGVETVDVAGPGFLNITLAQGVARADRRPGRHRR